MLSIEQCRGARGVLNWTQQDLADASGLSKTAINNFEKGHSDIKSDSLRSIKYAFVSAGIEFIGQSGLTKRTDKTEILSGEDAFLALYNDILDSVERTQGEILCTNYDMNYIQEHISDAKAKHRDEVFKKHPVKQRFLSTAENIGIAMQGREYRKIPDSVMDFSIKTCIYGESKVAFSLWQMSSIIIVDCVEVYTAERNRFNYLWERAEALQPKAASA